MKTIDVLFDWKPRYVGQQYLGKVVENRDPKQLCRVKVMISLYEGIDVKDLPWCYPAVSNGSGAMRVVNVPDVGSEVVVEFPYGDIHLPFYTPVFVVQKVPSELKESYPESYGWKDSVGNWVRVNKETREMVVVHSSGTVVRIEASGDVVVNCVKSVQIKASDDVQVVAGNSVSVLAKSVNIKASGGKGVVMEGGFSLKGDIEVEGSIYASGAIIDSGGNTNHHTH